MKFKEYTSIENSYREKYIQIIQSNGLDRGIWVATEKIHGANFSFWCDGKRVTTGKRTNWTGTDFYNCEQIFEKYSPIILKIYKNFCDNGDILTIFGELYGPKIQTGNNYVEEKNFIAFYIMMNYQYLIHILFFLLFKSIIP